MKTPDPRNQFLVGIRGSNAGAAPLQTFLQEMRELPGAAPRPMRDPRFCRVQLTDAEVAKFRKKYRDTLLIEPDQPLTF